MTGYMNRTVLALTVAAAFGAAAGWRDVHPQLMLEAPRVESSGGRKRPRRPTGIAAARRAAKKRRAQRGR